MSFHGLCWLPILQLTGTFYHTPDHRCKGHVSSWTAPGLRKGKIRWRGYWMCGCKYRYRQYRAFRQSEYQLSGLGPSHATDHLRPVAPGEGVSAPTMCRSFLGMGCEPVAPGERRSDARSALGLVLRHSVRCKVKTTVAFLETTVHCHATHELERGTAFSAACGLVRPLSHPDFVTRTGVTEGSL